MESIALKMEGNHLLQTGRFRLTKHCAGWPVMTVSLPSEYEEFSVYAVFEADTGLALGVPVENGECIVPWEVTDDADQEVKVGLFVSNGMSGALTAISSNMVTLPVDEGTDSSALEHPAKDPTPTTFEVLRWDVENLQVRVKRLEEDKTDNPVADEQLAAAVESYFTDNPVEGEPGITPHIGDNGNWYIGETDTGVKAQGEDGVGITDISLDMEIGDPASGQETSYYLITMSDGNTYEFEVRHGKNGKSAYQQAQEGGFEGTEEEFVAALMCSVLYDTTVEANSTNAVTGGAVYNFVNEKTTSVYRFKGTVATGPLLLGITDAEVGDVYNVTAEGGMNYAWTGEKWDALGMYFTVDTTVNKDSQGAVSGSAVIDYVAKQFEEYDSGVMTLLGVDEE